MAQKSIFRVVFHSQGNVYELYAREVSQGAMYAFVEVGDIIFGERSKLVVDPSEEKLKSEFSEVKRTYIPLHAVIRIDEVEKEGKAKITPTDGEKIGNISPFPMPLKPPAIDVSTTNRVLTGRPGTTHTGTTQAAVPSWVFC